MTPDVPVPGPESRLRACQQQSAPTAMRRKPTMLTIAIALLVLWALGLLSGYALGGLIHLLLVIAVVVFALQFFTGRRIA